MSVKRHKDRHLPSAAITAKVRENLAVEKRTGSALLLRIEGLVATLERTVDECEKDKDRRNLIAAANAIKGTAELIARLTGELSNSNQVNVAVNVPSLTAAPEYPIVMQVIRRHPEIASELDQNLREAGY